MRISTSQIYEAGALNIQRNQSSLYKLQNQLATGRSILTPADDPVASAQALVVTQAASVNSQYVENQKNATSQLGLVDSQLSSLVGTLQNARVLVVQAGNPSLSASDRASLADDLESRLNEALGIANAQNGTGDYLFSGYQGGTQPFGVSGAAPQAPATTSPIAYYGDNGERLLQVSASRQMPINVAGSDVFMSAKSGNGTFVARTSGNTAGGINQGAGVIDAGTVLNPQKWQQAVNGFGWTVPANPALQVRFTVAAGTTTYQLFDVSDPAAPVAVSTAQTFTPGQTISLASTNPPAASATDFGSQVKIEGQPADGDTFSVTPSTSQSLFQTLQNLVATLRAPPGSVGNSPAQYSNELAAQLTNLDQATTKVSQVESSVGARMRELDSLGNMSSDVDLQYQDSLSKLTGLDYAKAISEFTMQQTNLQAAQKSFVQVAGMSLFNIL
jgi:flagellar hook-associated protein 3 FlgL